MLSTILLVIDQLTAFDRTAAADGDDPTPSRTLARKSHSPVESLQRPIDRPTGTDILFPLSDHRLSVPVAWTDYGRRHNAPMLFLFT